MEILKRMENSLSDDVFASQASFVGRLNIFNVDSFNMSGDFSWYFLCKRYYRRFNLVVFML